MYFIEWLTNVIFSCVNLQAHPVILPSVCYPREIVGIIKNLLFINLS